MIEIIIPTCKTAEEIKPLVDEVQCYTPGARIIATCQPVSAAMNRNCGLNFVTSEIFIMMDDDISGFYPDWDYDLRLPLTLCDEIMIVSARLHQPDGKTTMGAALNHAKGIFRAENDRVATACIAMRNNPIRFDERFLGSGYEDTHYMQELKRKYGPAKVWVTNHCNLVHNNEMKNQGGQYWKYNHNLYMQLNPDDEAVRNQEDWTDE